MLKYKGGGYLVGIPARNLTDEEVKKYGKRRLIESGLYIEDVPKYEPRKKFKRSETEASVVEDINDGTGY
jgi:hypothetical protein